LVARSRQAILHGDAGQPAGDHHQGKGYTVADSIYKVIDIVGTSTESWEAATRSAVETASKTLRDLRVAEVEKLDVTVEDGKVAKFRSRLSISFKYESD
jgi:dodecin